MEVLQVAELIQKWSIIYLKDQLLKETVIFMIWIVNRLSTILLIWDKRKRLDQQLEF